MSQRPFQYSLRGMLMVTTATAALCALLVHLPALAAGLGAFVAMLSVESLPYLLFPGRSNVIHKRSDRGFSILLALIGILFTVWTGFELARPPGERGMAVLAGVLAVMMLALAAAIYSLGRRRDE